VVLWNAMEQIVENRYYEKQKKYELTVGDFLWNAMGKIVSRRCYRNATRVLDTIFKNKKRSFNFKILNLFNVITKFCLIPICKSSRFQSLPFSLFSLTHKSGYEETTAL
jgi:hypothetical protein